MWVFDGFWLLARIVAWPVLTLVKVACVVSALACANEAVNPALPGHAAEWVLSALALTTILAVVLRFHRWLRGGAA